MSPAPLLRACAEPGCPELVQAGRCPAHARVVEQRRGTATSRGYDSHWTRIFRPWFIAQLIKHGIAPACGAALPGGPSMADSHCKAEGRLNGRHLHLDHDPPLTDAERRDRRAVEDPTRVGFLCRECHGAKTQREQHAGLA